MPTREVLASFWRDWDRLTPSQQRAFRDAVAKFVADLKGSQGFRPGLRVKRVQGHPSMWEMTWAPDGRATFQYGKEVRPGERHVIWRPDRHPRHLPGALSAAGATLPRSQL